MRAADISNYTSTLTPAALADWQQTHDVRLAIVQAVDPPPGYPAGKTAVQVQQCLDAGLVVDAYIWLWFALDVADVQRKLALIDSLAIRRLWLDVEDTAAENYSQVVTEQKVADALGACDEWMWNREIASHTGIYSGRWFWTGAKYMANTTAFSDRDLWTAQYDDIESTDSVVLYGGWTACAIKQYRGSTSLSGVTDLDLNVLSDEEAAEVNGDSQPVPEPDTPDDCQRYRDALERGVNRLQIELERKSAAGKSLALRRTIVQEIQSELFRALQQ